MWNEVSLTSYRIETPRPLRGPTPGVRHDGLFQRSIVWAGHSVGPFLDRGVWGIRRAAIRVRVSSAAISERSEVEVGPWSTEWAPAQSPIENWY